MLFFLLYFVLFMSLIKKKEFTPAHKTKCLSQKEFVEIIASCNNIYLLKGTLKIILCYP